MVKYYIIIGIIYTIPYIVTIVISGLRKKLETDRNFYGKTIDIHYRYSKDRTYECKL